MIESAVSFQENTVYIYIYIYIYIDICMYLINCSFRHLLKMFSEITIKKLFFMDETCISRRTKINLATLALATESRPCFIT